MLENIKALVFDKDGLLFDSERMVQRSWNYAGEKLGYGEQFGNHIYNTIGFNVVRREAYFRTQVDENFPMEEFGKLSRAYFLEIEEKEGIPMKKGVMELIHYAKRRGMKIAVATSSSKVHSERVLNAHHIFELLDASIYGDMVKHSKPDPEIYLGASDLLGVPPEHCMALEDSPAGIESAYAAGMVTVMIPDMVEPSKDILEKVHFLRNNLLEIIDVLDENVLE